MPVTINSNIASLNAQRRLQESTSSLSASFQRLSSGLRINRASDDAAGLAIGSSLQTDSRVYAQAVRNLNDGLSAYAIATGAARELTGVVTRIAELAEQAGNGTLGNRQRRALDAELQALRDEYNRIIRTTSFNGRALLSGGNQSLDLQAGFSTISLSGTTADTTLAGDLTFNTGPTVSMNGIMQGGVSADLNGDGKADLIASTQFFARTFVFIGNGNGSFRAGVSYSGTGFADTETMATDDVNGDNKIDIISANATGNVIQINIGNGDGTLRAPVNLAHLSATTVKTGDFNGDGRTDLVSYATNDLRLWVGNEDGTFSAPVAYTGGFASARLAVADLNGDGLDDVVNSANGTTFRVYLGTSGGTLSFKGAFNVGGGMPCEQRRKARCCNCRRRLLGRHLSRKRRWDVSSRNSLIAYR